MSLVEIGLRRRSLDIEKLVLAALKGRPDRGEIALPILLCVREKTANWLCSRFELSEVVVEHLMTYRAFDMACPSEREMKENKNMPAKNRDMLWMHAATEECDRIGSDALQEIHGAVLDECFAKSYSKNINWQVPFLNEQYEKWLLAGEGEALCNFIAELKKRTQQIQIICKVVLSR